MENVALLRVQNRILALFPGPSKTDVEYEAEELTPDYWINLSLAEFWSKYEVVYNKNARKNNSPQDYIVT